MNERNERKTVEPDQHEAVGTNGMLNAYNENDHIEVAPDGQAFGHHRKFKYRVLGKGLHWPIHHTNDLEDARSYFNKCRMEWLEKDKQGGI